MQLTVLFPALACARSRRAPAGTWALTAAVATIALAGSSCVTQRSEGAIRVLAPSDFVVSDPDAWVKSDKTGRLDLVRTSKYSPPHRSPVSLAILEGQEWASFELEVQARSTGRVYGHQDLCLIFGYQDPAHFYYCLLYTSPSPRDLSTSRMPSSA